MLIISEHDIAKQGPGRIMTVCWRQWQTERKLARRGIRFRATALEQVLAAYAAMSQAEFDAINGPQEWANWRTIPRALNGHVPDRPLRVLDLGCGTGSSTRVLAHYCPQGSHITGYEMAEPILVHARRRTYQHRSGTPANVDFVCQPITEPFPEADASVDVINASGIIGHHLRAETMKPVLAEIERVLAPGGVALLDIGPTLRGKTLRRIMSEAGFEYQGRYRCWVGDRTGQMVFRKPPQAATLMACTSPAPPP